MQKQVIKPVRGQPRSHFSLPEDTTTNERVNMLKLHTVLCKLGSEAQS